MKLKYKKLIIVISVLAMAVGFLLLTLIDSGSTQDSTVNLEKNSIKEIDTLITNFFQAKKNFINSDSMADLVSDKAKINENVYRKHAEIVEDYKDFECYVVQNKELQAYRVYVKFNMKLKAYDPWVPSLTAYYVKVDSNGKYLIYLSSLDPEEEKFITTADENESIIELKEQVDKEFEEIRKKNEGLNEFYNTMNQTIEESKRYGK